MKNITDAQIREALIHVLTTDFEKDTTIDDITVAHIISWLENQSTHESPDDIIDEAYQQQADDLIDMIEPKFKIGDWVVNHVGYTRKIVDIKNDYYYYIRCEMSDTIENPWHSPIYYVDEQWHKWTILDAKEGDVLVSANDQPFLYNGFCNPDNVGAYCGIEADGEYLLFANETCKWTKLKNVHPATKEQRDTFFNKMNEAGYTWDAENKNMIEKHDIPIYNFKVDDWIVYTEDEDENGDLTYTPKKVIELHDNKVKAIDINGVYTVFPKSELKYYHLWTIDDARDGDVLAFKNNIGDIIICKSPTNYITRSYCRLVNNHFIDVKEGGWSSALLVPATKEQCDMLFQKIAEECYEWDANKKKLEKQYNPKFKVGDWICNDMCIIHIVSIKYGMYYFDEGDGINISFVDSEYHLWTIDDAKPGDVLSNGDMTLIFKQFEEPAYKQHVIAYIGLGITGHIQVTDGSWMLGIDKVKPATKEQCEKLFAKMKEEGYTWDKEKKELKKCCPKFKVGDWIANMHGSAFLIDNIDVKNNMYEFSDIGYSREKLKYERIEWADNNYHIWTIDDAQAGDILSFEGDDDILISYKSKATLDNKDCILSDFSISFSDIYNYDNYWEIDGFEPANKAQRDMLQKKMNEMKNNDDANKWTALDERMYSNVIECLDERRQCIDTCDMMQWLTAIKQRLQ